MERLDKILIPQSIAALKSLYGQDVDAKLLQFQPTRKEFSGDITLVVFPLLRFSKKKPEETARDIGQFLKEALPEVSDFNVIKGFLNLEIDQAYWLAIISEIASKPDYGCKATNPNAPVVVVEYSSPNTNKPLHLGHIRNNLLGYSVSEILKANGKHVVKVNLVNDRGIHICKSMLAYQKFGNGEKPSDTRKGDHLVGDYYVRFDQEYKKEVTQLINTGLPEEEAKQKAPILLEAQEMLRRWEKRDPQVVELWQTMNNWVYDGFGETYRKLGVDFDKIYYESDTYLLGKNEINKALEQGILFQKEDRSVWIDLKKHKLDQKLLLRSDGTSVYMTQDIGTAILRQKDFHFDKHIYVVGNEQDYHFKVLSIVLKEFGYKWAEHLLHLSYGMVELPEGKMKSREGTVVDADDLIAEMVDTSGKMSQELGKLEGYSPKEAQKTYYTIAMAALKYFMLKVDPKKNMLFDPRESIDFNGNTGPFIQYSYTRIRSIFRSAQAQGISIPDQLNTTTALSAKEIEVAKLLYRFPEIIEEAAQNMSPALIANYVYDLAKEYNQFYHDHPVLKEQDVAVRDLRLLLSQAVAQVIRLAMKLLGIDVPERM